MYLLMQKRPLKTLKEAESFNLTDVSIKNLSSFSTESADRVKGARMLVKASEDRHIAYIIELLRDINPEVRSAAMLTAREG